MASIAPFKECFTQKSKEEEEEIERSYARYKEIVSTLQKGRGWTNDESIQYQGFWHQPLFLLGVMWMQEHFQARPDDVLLVTCPKSGTTWFKALVFSIMNRNRFDLSNHPSLTSNPHQLVPSLERDLFKDTAIGDPEVIPSPRIFATHTPYTQLPESVISSGCPVVYVCRNPKGVFVSMWHFASKLRQERLMPPLSVEEAFDMFCNGESMGGPFWDHVLGFWKASQERPDMILFLKYEDAKSDPTKTVKKLAKFLGRPFSQQEEEKGLVEEIIGLCSFENLSSLEVNKTGIHNETIKYNMFFREGKVGDWKNHLTAEMIDRLDGITKQKLACHGLTF